MIKVFGKVILAGEHAVVRGQPAAAVPLRSRALTLSWENAPELDVGNGPFASALVSALEKAAHLLGESVPRKKFTVESQVPPRAGLGSSATLSVAVARFFRPEAEAKEIFPIALELENIFHGKSSGLDVAVAIAGVPVFFRNGEFSPLASWNPPLSLTDTGQRSSTKACVEKVVRQNRQDLDRKMGDAALLARDAFANQDTSLLAESFHQAAQCFEEWGLVTPQMRKQMEGLKNEGALAVKPTGSGEGGFLLALWRDSPKHLAIW